MPNASTHVRMADLIPWVMPFVARSVPASAELSPGRLCVHVGADEKHLCGRTFAVQAVAVSVVFWFDYINSYVVAYQALTEKIDELLSFARLPGTKIIDHLHYPQRYTHRIFSYILASKLDFIIILIKVIFHHFFRGERSQIQMSEYGG